MVAFLFSIAIVRNDRKLIIIIIEYHGRKVLLQYYRGLTVRTLLFAEYRVRNVLNRSITIIASAFSQ